MRHWVIDTNVVMSGLLTGDGNPARVLDAIIEGHLMLVYDARLLAEYRDVLSRPRLKLNSRLVGAFLDGLRGQQLVTPRPVSVKGPDQDDLVLLEAALATTDQTIVTRNTAHFPLKIRQGVHILTPAEAVQILYPNA
ncbi:MAG: putative toxin-antitoxin system toxin component, PIN family [Cephaloticoccus sp.]|nr:putative toxin-antitoxin system toxin component, PIN family [Cephaloticoccus sp.]MCF7759567.1 putative toxin-antitoxin system toxin component, PIN family [Cephaloticoccus sp.]